MAITLPATERPHPPPDRSRPVQWRVDFLHRDAHRRTARQPGACRIGGRSGTLAPTGGDQRHDRQSDDPSSGGGDIGDTHATDRAYLRTRPVVGRPGPTGRTAGGPFRWPSSASSRWWSCWSPASCRRRSSPRSATAWRSTPTTFASAAGLTKRCATPSSPPTPRRAGSRLQVSGVEQFDDSNHILFVTVREPELPLFEYWLAEDNAGTSFFESQQDRFGTVSAEEDQQIALERHAQRQERRVLRRPEQARLPGDDRLGSGHHPAGQLLRRGRHRQVQQAQLGRRRARRPATRSPPSTGRR